MIHTHARMHIAHTVTPHACMYAHPHIHSPATLVTLHMRSYTHCKTNTHTNLDKFDGIYVEAFTHTHTLYAHASALDMRTISSCSCSHTHSH
jgi:hypothetical protein